jgi:hypothetical protein
MKRIEGRTDASFHRGMSGLSAHVAIRVQLTCRSGMTLTGPGGVTSSVSIWTQTLWYDENFFVLFKFIQFRIFDDLYMKFICFSPANFVNGLTWRSPRSGR